MTTDPMYCSACGASRTPADAGAACPACGADARPVAKPVARPVAKPVAKPVARPTATPVAPPPARASSEGDARAVAAVRRPVRAAPPAAAAAVGDEETAPQPERRAHTRVMSAPRPDFAPKKKPPIVFFALVGLVVVGAAVAFIMAGGDDAPETPPVVGGGDVRPAAQPDPSAPRFDADRAAADALKGATGSEPERFAKAADELAAKAAALREQGASADDVSKLEDAARRARESALTADPNNAEARLARGETRYDDALAPFLNATYIPEFDRNDIAEWHRMLSLAAATNGGWVKKSEFDAKAKPTLDKYAEVRKRYDELAAADFGQKAKAMAEATIADVSGVFEGKATFQWFIHPDYTPYLVIIEESPAWNPSSVVEKDVFKPLRELHGLFLEQYRESNNLTPLKDPVPVIFFESDPRYKAYNESRGFTDKNVLAHFEPQSGRLVLHRNCTHRTVMHEGTHQLFSRYAKNKVAHHRQSFWFEEGIAEWFGGANRIAAENGQWRYEIGVMHPGRIGAMRGMKEDKYFKIRDLVNLTYADRDKWKQQGGEGQTRILLVYEQGWFLIYFLNYFDVTPDGYVKFGKGKYADAWDTYVKGELNGVTGRKAFEAAIGLDSDEKWAKLEKEYLDYFDFVNKKITLNHRKDDRLVPWNEYKNKRGEATGEKDDDLLVDPRKKEREAREAAERAEKEKSGEK
ncbi:MAG TPA: hypothetical protein VEI02_05460 [Planctomycetota bacterium]|nr:hypothetical protein [Planctomycetota bacterium]